MNQDVESRLRQMLAERADSIDPGDLPVELRTGPPGRTGWPGRVPVLVAATAAVVVAATLGALATNGHKTPSGPAPGASLSQSPTPGTAVAPATQADALRLFFSTDRTWLRSGLGGPSFGGRVYTGVEVMGSSADGRHLYLWVLCEEFYLRSGVVQPGTGVSVPLLATVTGSGPSTRVTAWRMPLNGSRYAASIRAMFPLNLAELAINEKTDPQPNDAQLAAQAARDLLGLPVDPKPTDTSAIANGITPSPQPPRTGGLFQVRQAPFGTSVWWVNNQWYGPVAGRWLGVYAGGPRTPGGGSVVYGAVRLISWPIDPNAPDQTQAEVGEFAPSPRVGALTIKAVSSTTVTLTDPTGRTVSFDLVTHRFSG